MIGEMLKKLRERFDYTQQQVADKLGIPRSTYSNYETGLREPDIKTLKQLSDIFSISIDQLTENNSDVTAFEEDLDISNVDDLIKKYNFKVDGRILSVEEARGFLAFVRANRSLDK